MSNPSVTATIAVDDQASPALKELSRLAKMIAQEITQSTKGSGDPLAQSFNRANIAAKQHLDTLTGIRNLHKEIAGFAAGIAGTKLFQSAKEAVSNFLPYEKATRYQTSIQSFNPADQKLLNDQRVEAAKRMGVLPMDTLKAQQAFVTRNYNASITKAATDQALVLAKALDIPADEAAKIVEGQTFAQGIHLTDAAQAALEMHKSADRATVAAKRGAMTPEDLNQFSKYAIGMSSAAGISPDQAFAMGMTLKKNNVGGDEAGVFVRQLSARLMAPTQKGFDAFAHMGINYGDYSDPDVKGGLTADAIDARMREHYAGKGLSASAKEGLKAALEDETRNVLGSRSEFAAAIREAVEASGETLSKTDQKHLATTALTQYDIARKNLRGGDLLEAILAKATPKDIQALMGDKQGGRASQLLPALDQYHQFVEMLGHANGFADDIAAKRMEGLGAAVDRLTSAMDASSKKLVAANQGVLEKGANALGAVAGLPLKLSDGQIEGLTAGAGLLSAAAIVKSGGAVLQAMTSLGSLATSANVASAALSRMAATSAVPSGVGAVAAAARGSNVSKAGRALGAVSSVLGWVGLGATVMPLGIEAIQSIPDGSGGRRKGYGRGSSVPGDYWDSVPLPMERSFWHSSAGIDKAQLARTNAQLRALDLDDESANGWQDSAKVKMGRAAEGGAKWGDGAISKSVDVTGTVSGSAEVHQNIQLDVRPTAYFESLVKRAENVSTMALNGKLGTSMQGPGDNGTKPTTGGFSGVW